MRPFPRPRVLFAVLALFLATASCRSTTPRDSSAAPLQLAVPIEGDPALAERVRILDPRFVGEGGATEARFSLLLIHGDEADLLLHVEWLDGLGHGLDLRPQTWLPIRLVRDAPLPVHAPAPSPHARSFRLKFQRPEAVR